MKKILVATDMCERCDDAIPYAIDLAKSVGAELHVVHGAYAPGNPDNLPPEADLSDQELESRLLDWTGHFGYDQKPTIRVMRGANPTSAIMDYVADLEIDLIVVGAERSGVAGLLEGDRMARSLVASSACPVTIVKRSS